MAPTNVVICKHIREFIFIILEYSVLKIRKEFMVNYTILHQYNMQGLSCKNSVLLEFIEFGNTESVKTYR